MNMNTMLQKTEGIGILEDVLMGWKAFAPGISENSPSRTSADNYNHRRQCFVE